MATPSGFAAAAASGDFIVQLGDLVDDGPDTPGALTLMFRLIDEGRGLFLLGNHDFKLARALRGDPVHRGESLRRTLAELPAALAERALREIMAAPAWIATPKALFVHGGYNPAMRELAAPAFPAGRPEPLLARALYGQTTGRTTGAGRPERASAGSIRSRQGSRCIAATTAAAPMAGPMSEQSGPAARRCSWTPAPARAGVCPGSISIR